MSDGVRVGIGYDSHRLIEGRALILGGERIPHTAGLKGHSDGDVLCHAITDAVLGAAAEGDIGRHFPDSDPRFEGANSLELLRQAVAIVRQAGYAVQNVDAVVIAELPKLAPHADRIRASLAGALGVLPEAVSVKGKTNEGMGEIGRAEGMAAQAVALLRRI
jgi:2-C-methyl-D-erythritol 2,4-cyclodiphosphate synthase